MKIKATYNFVEGISANYLKQKHKVAFETFENVEFNRLKAIPLERVDIRNGYSIYKDDEDEYLMFHYLPRYRTLEYNSFPKYHVHNCRTMNYITGTRFANKMPVDIYSTDEHKDYKDIHLELCKNCKRAMFSFLFAGSKNWYDAVLKYVHEERPNSFKSNGYHSMWSQLSLAYREKVGWKCEEKSCRIDLSEFDHQKYLHTHHINGNIKDNKESNFKALCLLCHALEHPAKLVQEAGFLNVDSFVTLFQDKLSSRQLNRYNSLMNRNEH